MDIASSWLASARLARKASVTATAFNAVQCATELGDESAAIEHARLLWKVGQHRKAIHYLQGAIKSDSFHVNDAATMVVDDSLGGANQQLQNTLLAQVSRAVLSLRLLLNS